MTVRLCVVLLLALVVSACEKGNPMAPSGPGVSEPRPAPVQPFVQIRNVSPGDGTVIEASSGSASANIEWGVTHEFLNDILKEGYEPITMACLSVDGKDGVGSCFVVKLPTSGVMTGNSSHLLGLFQIDLNRGVTETYYVIGYLSKRTHAPDGRWQDTEILRTVVSKKYNWK